MSTFKEKFPELKDKEKVIQFTVEEHNGNRWDERYNYISKEVFDITDIEKHCLSKQRVKETIKNYVLNGGSPSYAKEILEELGFK